MSSQPTAAIPPSAQLIQMGIAYWTSQLVFVAAQLGLADHLGTGPRTSDDLARELGSTPLHSIATCGRSRASAWLPRSTGAYSG